ncbi:hypothetical protein N658DRAFT_498211 [Parathielavia hyrcaniae]|uniref:N-acetyltransferase domain-containing protein n=1 Tax=Parathielavia hyrcaniae TaxID=113614 RepID=A0AAN6SZT2_9PEZI|nr:hypothetical protein N658DRAFT_498211 [Parathielavia hyrcaniae]
MPFTLRPGTQADVPLCGAIAQAAFAPSLLIQSISPGMTADQALAFWSSVAQSAMDDLNAHLVVAEDEDADTSPSSASPGTSVVGFAKWVFVPGSEVEGEVEGRGGGGGGRGPLPSLLTSVTATAMATRGGGDGDDDGGGDDDAGKGGEGGDVLGMVEKAEMAREYFLRQHERHERHMGGRRHWYLELISTKGAVKGSGAGRRLVQWGLDKADEDGDVAYLEASPEGKGLFERFGFRVVEKLEYADGAYVECCMIRGRKGE